MSFESFTVTWLAQVPASTTWVPLGVVFAISAIKEAVDDLRRYRQDRVANERTFTIVTGGTRRSVQSQTIRVGDVVLVQKDHEVPCDLFLLNAWDGNGTSVAVCTLETANLDGETNWKHRRVCTLAFPIPSPSLSRRVVPSWLAQSSRHAPAVRVLDVTICALCTVRRGSVRNGIAVVVWQAVWVNSQLDGWRCRV